MRTLITIVIYFISYLFRYAAHSHFSERLAEDLYVSSNLKYVCE